ncbi:MAG TPA: VOC family protein [Chryseosolibacter sp.]|nr:VOC family protein [Chryseosolibacter sp.]
MDFLRIKETCLYVRDLETAKKFYCDKLGLSVIGYVPGKHLFLRVGQSVLLLFNPEDSKTKTSPPPHYGGGKQHFAFEIESQKYAEARQEIQAKGITIIDEVTWPSNQQSMYFHDPEGNVLEIVPSEGIWESRIT